MRSSDTTYLTLDFAEWPQCRSSCVVARHTSFPRGYERSLALRCRHTVGGEQHGFRQSASVVGREMRYALADSVTAKLSPRRPRLEGDVDEPP